MAAHDKRLDALTPREREVLNLVRRGLTNEEIASRLGITLDGAKYHVSQILSKLGVASREEAAALAEPRGWPWRRLAGAAVVAAALAGIAVLAWSVLANEGDSEFDPSGATFTDVYARAIEALANEGDILHVTEENTVALENLGSTLSPRLEIIGERVVMSRTEYWIDSEAMAARVGTAPDASRIWVGQHVYLSGSRESGAIKVDDLGQCSGNDKAVITLLFKCLQWEGAMGPYPSSPHIEAAEFEGHSTIAIVFRRDDEEELPSPVDPNAWLHLDPESLLPIVWEGPPFGLDRFTYDYGSIPRDELPDDFFDPASIGWTGD